MERFCSKCGKLVSSEGSFCPECGAPMDSVVNLSKPTNDSVAPTAAPTTNQASGGFGGNQAMMPDYPQSSNYNSGSQGASNAMTTAQWVGTILLTSIIPIVSLVLLFVWAFGDAPQPKKNYCRAMLIIITAAVFALYLLIVIGGIGCVGFLGSGLADELAYYYY